MVVTALKTHNFTVFSDFENEKARNEWKSEEIKD
tara:strand:+ start:1958 stop:2059 length:102 start_codon:yes stop_codon:yes gene_type:complete